MLKTLLILSIVFSSVFLFTRQSQAGIEVPPDFGVCCNPIDSHFECLFAGESACESLGGVYQGVDSTCSVCGFFLCRFKFEQILKSSFWGSCIHFKLLRV